MEAIQKRTTDAKLTEMGERKMTRNDFIHNQLFQTVIWRLAYTKWSNRSDWSDVDAASRTVQIDRMRTPEIAELIGDFDCESIAHKPAKACGEEKRWREEEEGGMKEKRGQGSGMVGVGEREVVAEGQSKGRKMNGEVE